MDNRNSESNRRQSSRTASNADAIDCIVNTSDLVVEDDVIQKEYDRKRFDYFKKHHLVNSSF